MLRSDADTKIIDISAFTEKKEEIERTFGKYSTSLVAVYLFGSYVNGKTRPLSDIDIAILISPDNKDPYLETRILMDLMAILKTEKIDLVNLNEAPLHIQYGVLKNKKVIYSANDVKRVDFETEVIKEYLDFKHIREMHNKAILQKMGLGG